MLTQASNQNQNSWKAGSRGIILRKSELIKLGQEELITKLKDGQESLVNLRFQKALQQLEHPQRIRLVRREIAQIKTAIREFELGKRGN